MMIFNKLKRFLFPEFNFVPEPKVKNVNSLDFFDTVWVQDAGIIREGWVFDITKKHVLITVPLADDGFLDYRFEISNKSQIKLKNGKVVLYLNNPLNDNK